MDGLQQALQDERLFAISLEIASVFVTYIIITPIIQISIKRARIKNSAIENFRSTSFLFSRIHTLNYDTLVNFIYIYSKTSKFIHAQLMFYPAYSEYKKVTKEDMLTFQDWIKSLTHEEVSNICNELERYTDSKKHAIAIMKDSIIPINKEIRDNQYKYDSVERDVNAFLDRIKIIFNNADYDVREQIGILSHNLVNFMSDWKSIFEISRDLILILNDDDVTIIDIYSNSATEGAAEDTIQYFGKSIKALTAIGAIVTRSIPSIRRSVKQDDISAFSRDYKRIQELEAALNENR